ncbi:DUF3048 domain-containing protein [Brevibacillus sp. SYP-B805]|uniref:DUF3048 domain-containing protein n=1 Tax=Brevibacillus sp. SYP-B805 TaxID=1578199 RepID=UPI0013EDC11A|nr:DUF3048 domain-containing protein [Brevibacillus sp. SYP-B805]NGQ97000.1 DUF3048 domain-containing protein [Brevibacillus sp. SYP-B805]
MAPRWKPALFASALCAILTACSQEAEPPKPAQPKIPVNQPVQSQPAPEPVYAYTAPFTGMGTNERLDGRPIMVMINNHPSARPQSGLDKADIVYEVLAEGEITRFLAIFHSQQPEVIGPVRSIRPYFIKIGAGFDAVLVHAGGSPEALETLARGDYGNINEIANGAYFWRVQFRKMPHNLYTDLTRITQAIRDKKMRVTTTHPHLPFLPADAVISQGETARTIDVTYHRLYQVSYRYDDQTKRYLRFTEGNPHMDLTTNKQLSVTNLLVIAARHRVLDKEGRRDVDVVGPGDGYLFQQGKARKIKWKRSDGVIRAYADAGLTQELPLLPGNTWINIIPDTPGLASAVKFQ